MLHFGWPQAGQMALPVPEVETGQVDLEVEAGSEQEWPIRTQVEVILAGC